MSVPARQRLRFALVGMPNTGKSTLFNRLTGVQAKVANWPGMTVDLLSARVILGGRTIELVDLPGLYSLHGFGEDERLVRHFLEQEAVTALVVVVNAVQLERQLPLVLQLRALGRPLVVVLNMADEARRLGIRIDAAGLAARLSSPVLLVDAKHGHGIAEVRQALQQAVIAAPEAAVPAEVERLRADDRYEAQAAALAAEAVDMPHTLPARLTDRVDRVLLHPVAGVPLFFGLMLLLFEFVYGIGLPLQDGLQWLIDAAKEAWLAPALADASPALRSFVREGLVDGVGTVLTFLPVILVFFIAMALVEDSGYLVRIAFLMDRWMARFGLDGRAFVMQLMGMGCNVPAIMGTRVLRSRGSRLLAMLAIPFSLCSARLQVFLFLAAALFAPAQGAWVIFGLYLASFAAALLTAFVFRDRYRNDEPFVLELPPYRLPTLRQIALRAWHEVRHFLRRATRFIVAGVMLVWLLTHLPAGVAPGGPETFAGMLGRFAEPVLAPIGIDERLTVALILGFVAKEILIGALAVIFGLEGQSLASELAARIDVVQGLSFMLFTLIYTPCVSTIATMRSEARSTRFALVSVGWSLALAWVVSFAFYRSARALGW